MPFCCQRAENGVVVKHKRGEIQMNTQITLTADQAHDLISTLMRAAGRLSDIQEMNGEDMDKFSNNLLNAAKSNIFDVIGQIDPRK
jgi:hypothetical protein